MARICSPVCRLCRREGRKLYLKGDKCESPKCPVSKRAYAPGQHGASSRSKPTPYSLQLREKQKAKRVYGVLERQFRKYFEIADRFRGVTGANLLILLERRLDNVVHRLGFAPSRRSARQLITHGNIIVNGEKTNVPSYLTKVGDVVTIKEHMKTNEPVQNSLNRSARSTRAKWLEFSGEDLAGKVIALPTREDVPPEIEMQEQLIVELYSK